MISSGVQKTRKRGPELTLAFVLQQAQQQKVVKNAEEQVAGLDEKLVAGLRSLLLGLPEKAFQVAVARCIPNRDNGGHPPGSDPHKDPNTSTTRAACVVKNRQSALKNSYKKKLARLMAELNNMADAGLCRATTAGASAGFTLQQPTWNAASAAVPATFSPAAVMHAVAHAAGWPALMAGGMLSLTGAGMSHTVGAGQAAMGPAAFAAALGTSVLAGGGQQAPVLAPYAAAGLPGQQLMGASSATPGYAALQQAAMQQAAFQQAATAAGWYGGSGGGVAAVFKSTGDAGLQLPMQAGAVALPQLAHTASGAASSVAMGSPVRAAPAAPALHAAEAAATVLGPTPAAAAAAAAATANTQAVGLNQPGSKEVLQVDLVDELDGFDDLLQLGNAWGSDLNSSTGEDALLAEMGLPDDIFPDIFSSAASTGATGTIAA